MSEGGLFPYLSSCFSSDKPVQEKGKLEKRIRQVVTINQSDSPGFSDDSEDLG